MSEEPRIPRPGIDCSIIIRLRFGQSMQLTEHDEAEIQANLNGRFKEPQEMGTVSITFRSEVTSDMLGNVNISTTLSSIEGSTLNEVIDIVEDTTSQEVSSWEIDTQLSKKEWDIDEKLRFR